MTTDPAQLIHAYIEGDLSPEQAADLSAWVELSDANAEHFVRSCVQHYLLREQAVGKDLAESAFNAEGVKAHSADDADETEDLTSPGLLKHLAHLEVQAQASNEFPAFPAGASRPLTKKTYVSALLYVFEHTFTPKRVAICATAATLLLGVVLAIVMLTGSDEGEPVAGTGASSEEMFAAPRLVAALTAEHDAVWDRRPGGNFYAGQRFELTEGFAEITTKRGAVGVIEAPASIELLDNDNAIYLHAGKLVGICETASSRGFVVRTPHLDVTDLGTRFGVDASSSEATEVHVFDGEVEVVKPAQNGVNSIRQQLVSGDAVRATETEPGLVKIEEDRIRFVSALASLGFALPGSASDAGIRALTGQVAWSPSSAYIDTPLSSWRPADHAVVIEELPSYRLEAEVPVTLLSPGTTQGIVNNTFPAASIPAGTTVRTYVVLFYPATGEQVMQCRGAVTFEGDVIGIATQESQAEQFTDLVAGYAKLVPVSTEKGRWADLYTRVTGDVITLKQDRRTVTFEFEGVSLHNTVSTDAIRVFVLVSED